MPTRITSTSTSAADLAQQYRAAEVDAFAADDALDDATARGLSTRRLQADKLAADRRLEALGKAVIGAQAASIADLLGKAEIAAANLNCENNAPGFGDCVMASLIADLRRLAGAA